VDFSCTTTLEIYLDSIISQVAVYDESTSPTSANLQKSISVSTGKSHMLCLRMAINGHDAVIEKVHSLVKGSGP
jgi:hypothetical protein